MNIEDLPDPSSLTHEERLALLAHVEQCKAALEAVTLRTLEAIRVDDPSEKQYAIDEVAVTLRWDYAYTGARFALAQSLTARLPGVLDALADGRISAVQAAAIDRGIPADVAPKAVAAIQKSVLAYAPTHGLADTNRKIKRDVNREDPHAFARQVTHNREGRQVWSRPTEPGIARVGADLPLEGAAEVMAAIENVAAGIEPGTADQRRADALVRIATDVLAGGCSHCNLPARPVGPVIHVTIARSTLLGTDEQAAELNGEPIPAELARVLAADEYATWRRWITNEMGHLQDISADSYRPPKRLRDYVTARHTRCAMPGCRRRSTTCDLDHCNPWPAGETAPWNLLPLCSRHHHLKHEANWTVELAPDGTVTWTTPTGQQIDVPPTEHPIDTPVVISDDNHDLVQHWLDQLTPVVVPDENDTKQAEDEAPPF